MRSLTFPNVARYSWEALKKSIAHDTGIAFDGDSGEHEAKGIEYSYLYDEAAQTLHVTEIRRSWYDPSEDVIEQKIHDGVEAALKN